ncbi:MAG TPA: YMGG-like glycine zipper-containing protein [Blastocatellia bacterium]|nr:YMGG-like glycine zipper-containing protein [Blastocatellia bacterium]
MVSRKFVSGALIAALMITSIGSGLSVSAQQRAYRVSEQEVDQLLRRIEQGSIRFRQSLYTALNQTRIDGTRQEDNINDFVRNFETSTATLRDRFRQRRDVATDVSEVLNRAAFIDRFMVRQNLAATAERDWASLRSDLDVLARYYTVTWRWDTGTPERGDAGRRWDDRSDRRDDRSDRRRMANLLTGTYQVDTARSDRVGRAARIATRGLSTEQQQRMREVISRRMEAPEMIAIEREGRNITIASTRAPQVTFEADGRERVEQTPRGRTIRIRTELVGDRLTVTSTGDRGNDFSVIFDAFNNGRELRVTRQMEAESLSQPVIVNSYYNKTSDVAQLDLYRETSPVAGDVRDDSRLSDEQMVAILDRSLTSRQAREGDRFTMTVQSPPEYRGAVIEGYLARVDRGGRVSGRTEMAINFERIRMPGGATRSFDGYIESIRTPNGEDVRVDNEGIVSERNSQTTRTVTRTGIGAAVGAVIGAIAGGGKGAAIGAAVGAGTGAGSVFVQGRDELDLMSGTEFTIRTNLPLAGQRPR